MCRPKSTRMIPPEKLEETCGTCENKVIDVAYSTERGSSAYVCIQVLSDRCGQIVEKNENPCDYHSFKAEDGERPYWGRPPTED